MYLQRIELHGFKSFAQKTVLAFTRPDKKNGRSGITAVVGPNGSGKSNIVDAVRWVLGEQSLRLLRGKKSTDVIFSGSANKAKLGMAEVSLHLNNEDGSAPIDFSEIAITRKIYQDGSSDYFLNKNAVRLFDILLLLARANFGQNTYSIIGQGMIDKIVNYSNQERKEFFDEATGVKQYQIKREKSVNKLKRSRENLLQASSLIQEIEPHLKSLTRQVNRLQKRQAVETELRAIQEEYYGRRWFDLDGQYRTLAGSFSVMEKKKIKAENDLAGLEEKIEALNTAASRREEFDRIERLYGAAIEERNIKMKDLTVIQGRLDLEYVKIGKQDVSWLENRRDEIKKNIETIDNEAADLEKQIARLRLSLAEKEKQQAEIVREFKTLEANLLEAQKEFGGELGISAKEIRQTASRLYARQRDFVRSLENAKEPADFAGLKSEAAAVFGEIESFYRKIDRQNENRRSTEVFLLQKKLSDFLKSRDSLVNEVNHLKIGLEVAVSQKKSLTLKKDESAVNLKKTEADLAVSCHDGSDPAGALAILRREKESLTEQIDAIGARVREAKERLDRFNEKEEEKKQAVFATQKLIHQTQNELNAKIGELNNLKIELTRVETKKEDLFAAMRQEFGEDYRPKIATDLQTADLDDLGHNIVRLKKQLEMIGGTDPAVAEEYAMVKDRYDFLSRQTEDLAQAIKDLEKIVIELDKMIEKQFSREFKKINVDFTRYFKQLFDGGSAKLILSQREMTEAEAIKQEMETATIQGGEEAPMAPNGQTPLKDKVFIEDKSVLASTGIDIEVSPPGKKIKNISMLSGGEKTMTALALICAIIANNPSPFILFDEVDAALDESNSAKFSAIIEELSRHTQFIVITHNRAIMARADVLYGVTMQGDGVSRLLSLKLEEAEKVGK